MVVLDGEHVVLAAVGDVGGGFLLPVHRVGRGDGVGDVHGLQQVAQCGDLVVLGRDRELTQHAPAVLERGDQVWGPGGSGLRAWSCGPAR